MSADCSAGSNSPFCFTVFFIGARIPKVTTCRHTPSPTERVPARSRHMNNNTRSLFTLITAATAVTALAAGMVLAISAPAPAAEDFGQAAVIVTASNGGA